MFNHFFILDEEIAYAKKKLLSLCRKRRELKEEDSSEGDSPLEKVEKPRKKLSAKRLSAKKLAAKKLAAKKVPSKKVKSSKFTVEPINTGLDLSLDEELAMHLLNASK